MQVNGQKKPRQVRVPRKPDSLMGMEDTGHLWAVSYADFLMVLLSFFVIFFSVNKDNKNHLIFNIMSKIDKDGKYKAAQGGSSSAQSEASSVGQSSTKGLSATGLPEDLEKKISQVYKNKMSYLKVENEKVIINLPDNAFATGSFELNSEAQRELDTLYKNLEPYLEHIKIGFVGHSDSRPVRQWAGREVSNNMDVSALRASRVLSRAIKSGLKSDHLYAVGAGSSSRNTRSLTLVISSYKGGVL